MAAEMAEPSTSSSDPSTTITTEANDNSEESSSPPSSEPTEAVHANPNHDSTPLPANPDNDSTQHSLSLTPTDDSQTVQEVSRLYL